MDKFTVTVWNINLPLLETAISSRQKIRKDIKD